MTDNNAFTINRPLVERLKAVAIGETEHPADGATALMVAAATILAAKHGEANALALLQIGLADVAAALTSPNGAH